MTLNRKNSINQMMASTYHSNVYTTLFLLIIQIWGNIKLISYFIHKLGLLSNKCSLEIKLIHYFTSKTIMKLSVDLYIFLILFMSLLIQHEFSSLYRQTVHSYAHEILRLCLSMNRFKYLLCHLNFPRRADQ